jgi:hypothetical protein
MNAFRPIIADRHCVSPSIYAEAQGFDLELARERCDEVAILRCAHDRGHFWLDDEEGEESCILGVAAADGEPIDLVAWPLADPTVFSTAHGRAIVLGEENILSPATWAFGGMLGVWRSPLAWLRDRCCGICLLDYTFAGPPLRLALGPLLCEDDDLAVDVHRLINPPPFHFNVYAMEQEAAA